MTTTQKKSLLTDPSKLEAPKAVIGMLYGQPGSRKTTTALSAPNPVLLDFDKGLHRVKPQYRVPSLQVESYEEVIELLDSGELNGFDTIVIDTGGKLVDRICEYVIRQDPKNGRPGHGPSQQGWGAVKNVFSAFCKRVRSSGKSVIFVCHESEEKNGEDTIKRPDIAGGSRKDIVKELDFMGYMELQGNLPVICFDPTGKFYAKNSFELDSSVQVPTLTEGKPNDFLARYLFKASDAKLAADNELRARYDDLIKVIDSEIASITTPAQANTFYAAERPVIWDSHYYVRKTLKARTDALHIEFDKETKKFVAGSKRGPVEGDGKADATETSEKPKKRAAKAKPAAGEEAKVDAFAAGGDDAKA
jgi:hypothetical protein